MNLTELIREHDETAERLIQAIESDDNAMVEELDKKLSASLSNIITHKTDDSSQLREKTQFLLNQILPQDQRTELTESICQQILVEISQ